MARVKEVIREVMDIYRLYRDNGKEHGNYYLVFRV